MNSFFRKTLSFFGFAEDEEHDEGNQPGVEQENNERNLRVKEEKPDNIKIRGRDSRKKVSFLSPVKDEIKAKVFIAEPLKFEEIQVIADNFKNNIPVLINLQKIDSEQSKRIIDFCSGLTYALEGNIRKVAEKVFLITPSNVEVTSKANEIMKEEGMYNPF